MKNILNRLHTLSDKICQELQNSGVAIQEDSADKIFQILRTFFKV